MKKDSSKEPVDIWVKGEVRLAIERMISERLTSNDFRLHGYIYKLRKNSPLIFKFQESY